MRNGWIGVDLDGTLAHYTGWNGGAIGEPIPAMVDRVKQWIADGQEVRIVTARVSRLYSQPTAGVPLAIAEEAADQMDAIQNWCLQHIGHRLKVTAVKDFAMICLYDDRCVQVEANTGRLIEATSPCLDESASAPNKPMLCWWTRNLGTYACEYSARTADYSYYLSYIRGDTYNVLLWNGTFYEKTPAVHLTLYDAQAACEKHCVTGNWDN